MNRSEKTAVAASLILLLARCGPSTENIPNETKTGSLEEFNRLYEQVGAAEGKDNELYRDLGARLLSFSPKEPQLIYIHARGLAMTGETVMALEQLSKIIDLGGARVIQHDDEAFASLAGTKQFADLLQRAEKTRSPVHKSRVAFTLKERDLIPEGVAYDPLKKVLYVSSIYRRKIVFVNENGTAGDFTREMQDGLLGVIGMEVDHERRALWVCSGLWGNIDVLGIPKDSLTYSSVYKFDVDTRQFLQKFELRDGREHFFNDLTIASNGDVFVTDTKSGDVFIISHEREVLETLLTGLFYPNGITLSDDEKELFVADQRGVTKINLASREAALLSTDDTTTLVQIDGLAFFQNSLIAHQWSALGGVFRYHLDAGRERVIRKETIEAHNPLFDSPTTGELAGRSYYYLANAQLRRFNQDGSIFPHEKLSEVYIMKADLEE